MSRDDPTFSHSRTRYKPATMDRYHHRQFPLFPTRICLRRRRRCPYIEFQTILALLALEHLGAFERHGRPVPESPATGAKLGAIDDIFRRRPELAGRRKPQDADGWSGKRDAKECRYPGSRRESFDATGGGVDGGSDCRGSGNGEGCSRNEKTHFLT